MESSICLRIEAQNGEADNREGAMASDVADDLADMEIFEGCTPEQLRALAQRLQPLRAEAGQVLMREGEEAVSFILIRSGRAEIRHTGEDGDEILTEVSPGRSSGRSHCCGVNRGQRP